jgi:hypothetical protein
MIITAEHPSLFNLWTSYRFRPRILALLAEVPEQTIHAMLMYQPIKHSDAQKVLNNLSTLIRRECTFETMYVPICDEKGNNDANTITNNTRESE